MSLTLTNFPRFDLFQIPSCILVLSTLSFWNSSLAMLNLTWGWCFQKAGMVKKSPQFFCVLEKLSSKDQPALESSAITPISFLPYGLLKDSPWFSYLLASVGSQVPFFFMETGLINEPSSFVIAYLTLSP